MGYDPATTIRLGQLEQELSASIQKGELPFLGHYSTFLYQRLVAGIHAELEKNKDPLWLFFVSISRWPAVFSTYLTHFVAEGYGAQGNAAVYPFIHKAIHTTTLSIDEREKLWAAFRKACLNLGLSVSPRRGGSNYMVEEYLRQAGVPLRYVGELVEKMHSYANEIGVPDDDDPHAIRLWQAGLKHRARFLAQPVQKALSADDEGFYVRLFVRLYEQAGSADDASASEIEKLFAQKISELKSGQTSRNSEKRPMAIPQFVFRDGQLGVELPPGENERWRFDIDGKIEIHDGTLERRFVPFETLLPNKVSIHGNMSIPLSREFWPDDTNNRFLVFNASGGLVCKGQLGQSEGILLEPGEYDLLLRFFPSDLAGQCEQLFDDPLLVLYRLALDPAQVFELTRGPAKATFRADTKPSLTWLGEKFRGILGNELYASSGLQLEVKVPDELFADGLAGYELHIDPGGLGDGVVVPLPRRELTTIDLSAFTGAWSPGLSRVLIELRRQGFQRAETRSSIYCWNGLEKVKNRTHFICSRLPTDSNLLLNESDNVKVDAASKTVTFRNDDQRVFRMAFQLPNGRRQAFTWAVPGVFMQLLNYQDGHATENPLKKGATLAATLRSREVLEVFSSSNGTIELGTFRRFIDFDRKGRIRLPVAGLVDYIGPGADQLRFTSGETMASESLLRLVSPHHILSFTATQQRNVSSLLFSTKDEVEELALSVKDLITGWGKEIPIHCNAPAVQGEGGFSVWLTCMPKDNTGLCHHELQFFLENWANGAWFVTFNAKINGRWGRFSNVRNDHFAYGMIVVGNKAYKSADISWGHIQALPAEQQLQILKRVHRRLMHCYASEAWEQLPWLEALWNKFTDLFAQSHELSPRLIALAEERDEGGGEPDWVPLYSLATKFPLLYSQLGRCYRELPNPRQLLSIKCLKLLGELKYGVLPLLSEGVLNNVLVVGFANPVEMIAGKPASGFSLKKFEEALKVEDVSDRLRLLRQHEWQPGEGDYLGSLHYRFAIDQLEANFRASMTGNEYRRGKALSLCRNTGMMSLQGLPVGLASGPSTINLSTQIYDDGYVTPIEQVHIESILKFLSLYARACRWEVRSPGCLEGVWKRAMSHLGSQKDLHLVLGYLLALGKDVFLYYLLLWEVAFKTEVDQQKEAFCVRKQPAGPVREPQANP